MRTLLEIIESAKDGNMPTHEECYYAMLVYSSMLIMEHSALRDILLREEPMHEPIRKLKAQNFHDMYRNALNKSPTDYLGWNHDPANPEYQKFRKMANKVWDKVVGDDKEDATRVNG